MASACRYIGAKRACDVESSLRLIASSTAPMMRRSSRGRNATLHGISGQRIHPGAGIWRDAKSPNVGTPTARRCLRVGSDVFRQDMRSRRQSCVPTRVTSPACCSRKSRTGFAEESVAIERGRATAMIPPGLRSRMASATATCQMSPESSSTSSPKPEARRRKRPLSPAPSNESLPSGTRPNMTSTLSGGVERNESQNRPGNAANPSAGRTLRQP